MINVLVSMVMGIALSVGETGAKPKAPDRAVVTGMVITGGGYIDIDGEQRLVELEVVNKGKKSVDFREVRVVNGRGESLIGSALQLARGSYRVGPGQTVLLVFDSNVFVDIAPRTDFDHVYLSRELSPDGIGLAGSEWIALANQRGKTLAKFESSMLQVDGLCCGQGFATCQGCFGRMTKEACCENHPDCWWDFDPASLQCVSTTECPEEMDHDPACD